MSSAPPVVPVPPWNNRHERTMCIARGMILHFLVQELIHDHEITSDEVPDLIGSDEKIATFD